MKVQLKNLLKSGSRNQELDFMRGVAIIVVMLRHHKFTEPVFALGTTGVQLFFVLSGFLVGGLIWREIKKNESIGVGNFILRRGFKIWPQFYVFVGFNILFDLFNSLVLKNQSNIFSPLGITGLFSELFFVQNYVDNLFDVTWSLAVEEHFYLLLPLVLYVVIRYAPSLTKLRPLETAIGLYLILFLIGFTCRWQNWHTSSFETWLYDRQSQFHLDALFFGVLLAAFNTYKKDEMLSFFRTYTWLLLLLSMGCIVSGLFLFGVPKIYEGLTYGLSSSVGYTILYWGFGIFTYLLYAWQGLSKAIKLIFNFGIYRFVAWTGFYSYSLYLYHSFIYGILNIVFKKAHLEQYLWINFVIGIIVTYIVSVFLTETLETYFLRIRDRVIKPIVAPIA